MIKVGIVGCSGYTAIEAIKLLLRHPQATIVAATSRQADGSSLVDMHPQFSSRTQLLVEDLTPKQVAERCDVAFLLLATWSFSAHLFGTVGQWLPRDRLER